MSFDMVSVCATPRGANLANYMDDAWRGYGPYVDAVRPASYSWHCSYNNPPPKVVPVVPVQDRELISDTCEYIRYPNPGSNTVSMLITTIEWVTYGILSTTINALIAEFTAPWHRVPYKTHKIIERYARHLRWCPFLGDDEEELRIVKRSVLNNATSTEVAPFVGVSDAGRVLAPVLQALISEYSY
jgi:hypothetical protein